LAAAVRRAWELYQNRTAWQQVAHNGMQVDFSWERAAGNYHLLYHRLKETVLPSS
jgi:glycogen synthase